MKRAALHNLGCKVNAYETEAMQQLLEAAGYEIVPFTETADVYIINTCSVTNVADKKSRQMLHRAKKKNPQAVVVAAGCYVQSAGEELRRDLAVDIVIGNNHKKDLVAVLDAYFAEHPDRAEKGAAESGAAVTAPTEHRTEAGDEWVIDIGSTNEYEPLSIDRTAEHTRAFIKVQDGCNQFCSYCIIPYTRGRVRSRRPQDVLQEVRALAANGCREIVLTGIHLSSYGTDFDEAHRTGLLELIQSLHAVEGIARIRLGSLEPRIVTEEFAAALAGLPKFCPHFHLSLQSGCDATLKRMNRHYTAQEYADCCGILRKAFENPAITTDVIVGFPGETEEEFAQTRRFLAEIGLYEMHIFKYSRRAGTRADRMPDQVPEPVKTVRSDELLALERELSLAYRRSFLGRPVEVLLEEPFEAEGKRYMIGHTPQYVKVAVPAGAHEKNTLVSGTPTAMLSDEVLLLAPEG